MFQLNETQKNLPVSAKTGSILINFFRILPIEQKKFGSAVMAEPDRGLYLVFQVVRVRSFRCDKCIERELRAEAEACDEAVDG